MHEFHLLRRIVHIVEELARQQSGGWPVLIRLRVAPHSHVATHSLEELQDLFQLAAQGTIAERATLALEPMPQDRPCPACRETIPHAANTSTCPRCGLDRWHGPGEADVLIHAIEWQDKPE